MDVEIGEGFVVVARPLNEVGEQRLELFHLLLQLPGLDLHIVDLVLEPLQAGRPDWVAGRRLYLPLFRGHPPLLQPSILMKLLISAHDL